MSHATLYAVALLGILYNLSLAVSRSTLSIVDLQEVNIGAIMTVSNTVNGSAQKCSALDLQSVVRVEAILYALEAINQDTLLLPNITLGSVILDDCFTPITALRRATQFIPATQHCGGNETLGSPGYPVMGVVGTTFSHTSVDVGKLMSVFKVAQLSYHATSDVLSDKTEYEYFSRVVPGDRHQSRVIVELLKFANWSYVMTVNSGGPYGENGIKQVRKILT